MSETWRIVGADEPEPDPATVNPDVLEQRAGWQEAVVKAVDEALKRRGTSHLTPEQLEVIERLAASAPPIVTHPDRAL